MNMMLWYFEGKTFPEIGQEMFVPERQAQRKEKEADTVKIIAQIPLSLSEPAKTMITTYSVKRYGAGNFLARGLRWAVGVVA